jgi:lysophospholipase
MADFAAPDGTTLAYDAYEPDRRPPAAILVLHGWSEHAGRYGWLGHRLEREGYATYVADLRGHGRSGGRRGHLSRFSQLLGDLQALRRLVRTRTEAPQILLGQGFGGLVALRYLETQPSVPPLASVVSGPLLAPAHPAAPWTRLIRRLLGDVWPSASLSARVDPEHLSRDPAANAAYAADPAVQRRLTVGAWREIRWAQGAVVADAGHIGGRLLFLLAGDDRIVDAPAARTFAGALPGPVAVRWYADMYHELFNDPQRERVVDDVLEFFAAAAAAAAPS